jgi:hypothetical protein
MELLDVAFFSTTVDMLTKRASIMTRMTTTQSPGRSCTNAAKTRAWTFDLQLKVAISKLETCYSSAADGKRLMTTRATLTGPRLR